MSRYFLLRPFLQHTRMEWYFIWKLIVDPVSNAYSPSGFIFLHGVTLANAVCKRMIGCGPFITHAKFTVCVLLCIVEASTLCSVLLHSTLFQQSLKLVLSPAYWYMLSFDISWHILQCDAMLLQYMLWTRVCVFVTSQCSAKTAQ